MATEKFKQNEFQKHKGRLVARGDQRRDKPTELSETFAACFSYPTFGIVLNVILAQNLSWSIEDITNAYLNAHLPKTEKMDSVDILMKLEKSLVDLMAKIDPSINAFRQRDGGVVVRLLKALFGLQESAKLWRDEISGTLMDMGFKPNEAGDRSLFFRWDGDKLSLALLYVDDVLFAAPDALLDKWRKGLADKYQMGTSLRNPAEFTYVGVQVRYDAKDKSFLLSQPGMAKKIGDHVEGTEEMPTKGDLFQETDDTSLENSTEYRSWVMELQYLARTRLDIKPTLAYLTTKCQSPTRGDMVKLQRLCRYVKGSIDYYCCVKPEGSLQVHATADASWGAFLDGKSVTGFAVGLGSTSNTPINAKSQKQKAVGNSSTAAELIALASVVEEVLWTIETMEYMGLPQASVLISQDNQSTMRLALKIPSGEGRTRWLNIKAFWISEYLENGKVTLKYVPSENILADGLSKPLNKKQFSSGELGS